MTTTHLRHKRSDDDLIPVDLVINILSRLPVKFIAKCRCVSKLWSSIIRRPNYNQLFPIKSPPAPATPRFLFIVETNADLVFSSLSQNPDYNTSLVATFHNKKSTAREYCKICPPVNGLVCLQYTGEKYTYAVISNPITGEYVTTPKVETKWSHDDHQVVIKHRSMTLRNKMYFGYDPIEKQFKVMCMTWLTHDSNEYQVLTLGTGGNLSWRKIQCSVIHYHLHEDDHDADAICINGLLYYQAIIDQKHWIVCFDVRSEKFSFVNVNRYLWEPLNLILINYKNKLGAILGLKKQSPFFSLLVLEDAEKHKWSHHLYKMPQLVECGGSFSAGIIGSDEIVLYRNYSDNPFIVRYCNLEHNITTSLCFSVSALDYVEYRRVHTFPNFVEDVKLML